MEHLTLWQKLQPNMPLHQKMPHVQGTVHYMDALSVHPYRYPRSPEESGFVREMTDCHHLIQSYDGDSKYPYCIYNIEDIGIAYKWDYAKQNKEANKH